MEVRRKEVQGGHTCKERCGSLHQVPGSVGVRTKEISPHFRSGSLVKSLI